MDGRSAQCFRAISPREEQASSSTADIPLYHVYLIVEQVAQDAVAHHERRESLGARGLDAHPEQVRRATSAARAHAQRSARAISKPERGGHVRERRRVPRRAGRQRASANGARHGGTKVVGEHANDGAHHAMRTIFRQLGDRAVEWVCQGRARRRQRDAHRGGDRSHALPKERHGYHGLRCTAHAEPTTTTSSETPTIRARSGCHDAPGDRAREIAASATANTTAMAASTTN